MIDDRFSMDVPRPVRVFVLAFAMVFTTALGPAAAQQTGLSFLKMGTSAVGLALGDGLTAVPSEAFATYYNPAGLAGMDSSQVAVSHNIWVLDTRTYNAAVGLTSDSPSTWGFAANAVSTGDIAVRTGPTPDPEGFFQAQFANLGISYARLVGPLRVGATAKYLTERIAASDANGYAFDAGLQLPLAQGDLQLGAALQHFGSMQKLNTEATRLPRTVRGGIAVWPFRMTTRLDQQPLLTTMVSFDVTHRLETEQTQVHVGLASQLFDVLTVRAGYISNSASDSIRRFSFGSGLQVEGLDFDYAFLPFEQGFGGGGHVLSLGYNW